MLCSPPEHASLAIEEGVAGRFPAAGGEARAVLMAPHPGLLFVYWVMDDGLRAGLGRHPGPAAIVVETSADGERFVPAARHPFDFRAQSWYLDHDRGARFVRAQLGMGEGAGFRPLLSTNVVRVARGGPGGEAERFAVPPGRGAAPESRPAAAPSALSAAAGPAREAVPRRRVAPAAASSPGSVNAFQPGRRPVAPDPAGRAEGDLCFVLHSHLPFVRHPERPFFLEENWLFEAMTETYLPILDMLEHLVEDGVPARLTLSLTPTLMSMLRDPLLVERYERHLRRLCDLARLEVERTRRDPDFGPVAGFYRDRLERLAWLFAGRYRRDLVGGFARLQEEGAVELIGCAATHGLLPALEPVPGSVRAQIATGVAEHARQIGRPPRGLWLPECGYYEGLEPLLREFGVEYFFVDAHGVRNAGAAPVYDLHAPILGPSGVAAFGRDEECSAQVWSAEHGYPGDPDYRDFYRDIGFDLSADYVGPWLDPAGTRHMTGLKYHRITGAHDRKEAYRRDWALRALDRHAEDFVRNRVAQSRFIAGRIGRPPLMVAMYDAELFGHWWFEGVDWLEGVLRRLPERGLRATTPGAYLDARPLLQVAEPATSSWGEGGYFDVWLRGSTDWIYPPLHDAARRMAGLAARRDLDATGRRALAQAGRELLLAQASDWPFIIKNGTAVEYATRRVSDHLALFDRLARQIDEGRVDAAFLAEVEARDNLFPAIDPSVWRSV